MRRVLVVDDEASVTDVIAKILRTNRLNVTTETDPTAALARFVAGERFDLAILDVLMPVLSGDELAQRLRQIDPDLKILFVTGYDEALFQALPQLWEGEAYLDKPFSEQGLREAVALLLTGTTRLPGDGDA